MVPRIAPREDLIFPHRQIQFDMAAES